MTDEGWISHPYIPNSVPAIKEQMLAEVGAESVAEFYQTIPDDLQPARKLQLPPPLLSESRLRRHVQEILDRNTNCEEYLNFMGGGCWEHDVPSVCDEVNRRGEFLTAYAGEPYDDHGRFQALFEFASMMGELVDMDVVCVPTYDWLQAAGTAVRMAARMTGRGQVLVARNIGPERLAKLRDYCKPNLEIRLVEYDTDSGQVDVDALRRDLSERAACVYFENPSYFGAIELQGPQISELAHDVGAESVVGVDPISLGVLAPPSHYGADIVCGDLQPLGMHMQYGGGHAGFIATRDEERYVMEYPFRLFGIAPTSVPGEYGFGDVAYERTSFAHRESGVEFVGTATALWGITAGVYLALMGPQGMTEIGEHLLAKSRYARERLGSIPGVQVCFPKSHPFKEFVLNFDSTGKQVAQINERLRAHRIFGGIDLSGMFPDLGQSALFCTTEVHTLGDIDALEAGLREAIQ
jgi:glycine dehydrogenase subunit 1